MSKQFFSFLIIFFLFVSVGSVCVGQLVSDTSIISLSGSDWSLKVDGVLQISLDSRNVPYMTSKSVSEKELFLELESFEDCKSGVVQFKVDMNGLVVYKQLPLDQELNVKEYEFVNATHAINASKVVVYRPGNIVNSFALFDDLGRKQVHISASKLVDASGAMVWCDSNLEGGLLTVILPLEWLEGAKFPVVLDPTFGYSTIGASEGSSGATTIYLTKAILSDTNVTLVSEDLYVARFTASPTTGNIKYAVYDDSNNLLYESSNTTFGQSFAWVNASITGTLNSGTYRLAVITDQSYKFKYDTLASNAFYRDGQTYPTFPNPITTDGTENRQISFIVEYTINGEPTPTPTPSPSPSPVPSVTVVPISEGELSSSMLFVLGFMAVFCLVSLVWFGKVPIVPLLIGLFTFLVALYSALGGVYNLGVAQGWFSLFVALFGGLTMLLVGLGVRVRR